MTNSITLRKTTIETIRYTCTFEGDTYFVDIIRDGLQIEAWLTRDNMGQSDLMFGMELEDLTEDSYADFIDTVEANLEGQIESYEEGLLEDEENRILRSFLKESDQLPEWLSDNR